MLNFFQNIGDIEYTRENIQDYIQIKFYSKEKTVKNDSLLLITYSHLYPRSSSKCYTHSARSVLNENR